MSTNLIFPSPVPQSWSWKYPIKKTPSFKTLVQNPANNRGELRVSLTQFPIWLFDVDLSYIRGDASAGQIGSAYQQIVGFFGAAQGAANDWLYFDPFDNSTNATVSIRNPNFELGSTLPPTGWQIGGSGLSSNCVLGYETTAPYAGNQSLIINASSHNAGVSTISTYAVTEGQTFQLTGALRSVSGDTAVIQFVWLTSGGSVAGSMYISTTELTWQYLSVSGVVPSGAITGLVQCFMGGSSGGEGEFDNIALGLVQPQTIGTGDGSTTEFLLTRQYNGLTDLIQNFAGMPVIWVGGAVSTSSNWSIDAYGNLTFNTPPTVGQVVAWSGQFYFRCRFLDDEWQNLQHDYYQIASIHSLKFKSLLL